MNRHFWIFPCLVCVWLAVQVPLQSSEAAGNLTDWPQWRGPNRDGKSPDRGLLQEWPEGGPPLAWRADGIGAGFSAVSVSNGHLFTMGDLDKPLLIEKVLVERERMPKEIFYIPALLLLGLIIFLQRRRHREDDPEAETTAAAA